jgi:two-component system response regulator
MVPEEPRQGAAAAGQGRRSPGGPVRPAGSPYKRSLSRPGPVEGIDLKDFAEVEILLVEDNPYDAELTLRALKSKGLANKVITFPDGVEALEFLFGKGKYEGRDPAMRPKVIFLDLKLPKMSGLEVLDKIRADARTKTIPVVILTSSQEESDIVKSYNLGVNSYLVKPVEFDKFFQAVEELGFYWLLMNKVPV